jgi:hypothetical protein
MDNTEDKALNQNAGEDTSVSTTPVEETKTTEEVPQKTVDQQPTGEPKQEESPKKGAQARIRELNAKAKGFEEVNKSLDEENKGLKERIAELTASVGDQVPQVPQFNPQQPIINPGEEIDGTELNRRLAEREQRILQQAAGISHLQTRQSEAVTRINNEVGQAIKDHPELDPNSDSFDKELSDSITEATMAYVRQNPYTASPKQFVDRMMKPYKRAVIREVAQETETITKQVSQTALRPSPNIKSEKKFEDLSLQEMENKLGVVY